MRRDKSSNRSASLSGIFVTGIGTDVGKTIVSAVAAQALLADYWKPVQSGVEDGTDWSKVAKLIDQSCRVHQPRYQLKQPLSPHAAAALDRIKIKLSDFVLPATENKIMVVEGAGGLFVPLNDRHLVVDMIEKLELKPILVVKHYLGSINHTLLSLEALSQRGFRKVGVILNGEEVKSSEQALQNFADFFLIGRVPYLGKDPSPRAVNAAAKKIRPGLIRYLKTRVL